MTENHRAGGSKDFSTQRKLVLGNDAWNIGAHREGWELLNWRENTVPGSQDDQMGGQSNYTAMVHSQDYETNRGQFNGMSYQKLVKAMKEEWIFNPEVPQILIPNRVFAYDTALEEYILHVPPTVLFSSIPSHDMRLGGIEAALEAEQELGNNADLLASLPERFGYVARIQARNPFIIPVNVNQYQNGNN